jgi:hypothetical protein
MLPQQSTCGRWKTRKLCNKDAIGVLTVIILFGFESRNFTQSLNGVFIPAILRLLEFMKYYISKTNSIFVFNSRYAAKSLTWSMRKRRIASCPESGQHAGVYICTEAAIPAHQNL